MISRHLVPALPGVLARNATGWRKTIEAVLLAALAKEHHDLRLKIIARTAMAEKYSLVASQTCLEFAIIFAT